MFQTFTSQSDPAQGPARLEALRGEMRRVGVDGFLVPRADVYQGEYVAPCDSRLGWLTGFTGSAGFCAVLADTAAVFVDGRYRVQVRDQVDRVFDPVDWPEISLARWLRGQLSKGDIGFDPWLHTVGEVDDLRKELGGCEISLKPVANLVDAIWGEKPERPQANFIAHPLTFSGETHADKRDRLARALAADVAVITLPDSIAWLLNIRGSDIERNPVPQAFAMLARDGRVTLYALSGKADGLAGHLGPDVTVKDETEFAHDLGALRGLVQIDPKSCPVAVTHQIARGSATIIQEPDPCLLPKAKKNKIEIAGAKAAHQRDAVAMVQFLAWLDAEAPKGHLTEIDVVKRLERFRIGTHALKDIAFETIAGAGPNAAIIHYRVNAQSNRQVRSDELLLVDSGGQYNDGTTDITRTIVVGTPKAAHIACYTRVLQGMIAISQARFPKGLAGQHLDALARIPLWAAGQDYDHGTGHGVGSYLSVHEGPQAISRRATVPFEPGMILSNEPGYYQEGQFGIRIENLIVVVNAPALPDGDPREMLAFETLTTVPLDRRLIDVGMLSRAEKDWIDAYHRTTAKRLAGQFDAATQCWLDKACAPL